MGPSGIHNQTAHDRRRGVSWVRGSPVLGWLLLQQHFSWHSVFWINVPAACLTLAAGAVLMPESSNPAALPVDVPGALLSTGAVTCLVWGFINGPEHGWTAAPAWMLLAASAVLLAAFLTRERRSANPVIDPALSRDKRFTPRRSRTTAPGDGPRSARSRVAVFLRCRQSGSGSVTMDRTGLGQVVALVGVGEGVEGLLDQVGQVGGSVVLDPGQDGGARGGQAGRDGDPVLEARLGVVLARAEGLQDELLGGDLVGPQALAERGGGDDELVLGEQGVALGVVDLPQPLDHPGQEGR